MGVLKRVHIFLFVVLFAATSAVPFAETNLAFATSSIELQEHKIKAGLVYNFLKYTNWQANQQVKFGHLSVCLLGGDPFDGSLNPLQGRTAQQQTIEINRIAHEDEASSCSIVIIHRNLKNALPGLLPALRRHHVMTISDIEGFARAGGMIELSTGSDRRIHLYINRNAVSDAHIQIQDRLLKLAEFIG